ISFRCGCSRERSAAAIVTVAREEINDILAQDGAVALHCDYCGTTYSFDSAQVAELYAPSSANGSTLH
ncbi:Hsp33 family molecular chaperone HslO, partial [Klebsiella pneumoniae]